MLPTLHANYTMLQEPDNTNSHLLATLELQSCMKNMLETSVDADIRFAVTAGAKELSQPIYFPAHKLILSTRSSYFNEMFKTRDLNKDNIDCITIEHCEPIVFKLLLQFIYTGECDLIELNSMLHNNDNAIFNLLRASERFQAADLRNLCENYLTETLSSTNCLYRLRMTEEIGQLYFLRVKAIRFVIELSPEVRTDKVFINELNSLPESLRKDLLLAEPITSSKTSLRALFDY